MHTQTHTYTHIHTPTYTHRKSANLTRIIHLHISEAESAATQIVAFDISQMGAFVIGNFQHSESAQSARCCRPISLLFLPGIPQPLRILEYYSTRPYCRTSARRGLTFFEVF
jgi:hypothetical protein